MTAKKTKKVQNKELKNQLNKLTLILVGVIAVIILAVVFAPQVGALFGLLSKNRNKQVEIPTAKPSTPYFKDLPESTKDKIITIGGYGQEGATIKLFVNGPEKAQTVVDSEGKFSVDNVNLISGKNTVFAKAVDGNGLESDKTNVYIIEVDNKAPEIEIETPKNGDTVKNLNKRIEIKGEIDEKATIYINDRLAVQRPDLSFDFLLGVNEGNIEIKIKAIDVAGNETEETIHVSYEKKSS